MKEKNNDQEDLPNAAAKRIGLSRMVKITNNQRDKLESLVALSIETLEGYYLEFNAAAEKKNIEELDNLIHKATMTIYYIEADKLNQLMKQTREALIEHKVPAEVLMLKIQETCNEFDSVIAQLRKVDIDALLKE